MSRPCAPPSRFHTDMPAFWRLVKTPVGHTLLAVDKHNWMTVQFAALHDEPREGTKDTHLLPSVAAWISSCLRERVGPPPVDVPHSTPFRAACWAACRQIPIGQTCTYTELATMAGVPKAARAAGSAMRNNPLSLITPCHRVVATAGLGGYAGARDLESPQLGLKSKILKIEQRLAAI